MAQAAWPVAQSGTGFDDATAVRAFRALGDCTRYKIVRLLVERGELGCGDIQAAFPLSAPCLSHHTRILQECGLIGLRKEGAFHFFHARRDALRLYAPSLLEHRGEQDCQE
jgi:DNA-binding transcriptional ArsR family regulator